MKEHNYGENNSYQTGSTKPPKDYGGRVAAVLVALIFVGGIVSALGMLNIKPAGNQTPQEEEESPICFDSGDKGMSDLPLAGEELVQFPELGFSGEFFSEAYRQYYHLPQGVHVTQVEEGGPAQRAGVMPGDILTAVNETPLENAQVLETALEGGGETLLLNIYRNHETISVALAPEQ